MNVTFDPMIGFKVRFNQSATLADAFICEFKLGNVTGKMKGIINWMRKFYIIDVAYYRRYNLLHST